MEYIKFVEGILEYEYLYGYCKVLNGYVLVCCIKFDVEYKVLVLEEFKVLLEE